MSEGMMNKNIRILALSTALLIAMGAHAGELTYKPINPSFGGDPFNGTYLLSNAQAQNQYEDEDSRSNTDSLQNFSRTVTSSLLNRLSFDIADAIFGEDAQDSGQFRVGDTQINFQRNGDVVTINIADALTGETTTVELPVPQF